MKKGIIFKFFDRAPIICIRLAFILVLFVVIISYTSETISSGDMEKIMSMLEILAMISATLAILSFTYALAVKGFFEKNSKVLIKIGERFFKATVLFIIGISLLHFSTNFLSVKDNSQIISKSITDIISLALLYAATYQFGYGVFDVIGFLFSRRGKNN